MIMKNRDHKTQRLVCKFLCTIDFHFLYEHEFYVTRWTKLGKKLDLELKSGHLWFPTLSDGTFFPFLIANILNGLKCYQKSHSFLWEYRKPPELSTLTLVSQKQSVYLVRLTI